jgi:hypothetical protein
VIAYPISFAFIKFVTEPRYYVVHPLEWAPLASRAANTRRVKGRGTLIAHFKMNGFVSGLHDQVIEWLNDNTPEWKCDLEMGTLVWDVGTHDEWRDTISPYHLYFASDEHAVFFKMSGFG